MGGCDSGHPGTADCLGLSKSRCGLQNHSDCRAALSPQPGRAVKTASFLEHRSPIQTQRLVTMKGEHGVLAPFELTPLVTSVQTENKRGGIRSSSPAPPRDTALKSCP